MPTSAFVALGANDYQASELTRGPWHPDHQHAGPPIALVCRAIESAALAQGLTHVARLTTNLLRPVPIGRLTVEVTTEYAGRNVGHYSARLIAGDKEVARFTALMQSEVDVPLPAALHGAPARAMPALSPDASPTDTADRLTDAPGAAPPALPLGPDESPPAAFPFAGRRVGYADLVETRIARGRFFRGPCAAWFRLRYPLVEGEVPSVYQRVAVAADSGNGISAILDFAQYSFVNSDLTINLLRRPRGEWICLDARTHLGPSGCGLAVSNLFDTDGRVGVAAQSLVVRLRPGAS